ncbi:MAG: hypothetical protein IJU98_04395 [Synergistaceae bacterium]|nr:hypothetical protein [Synergistaceae bacterium]
MMEINELVKKLYEAKRTELAAKEARMFLEGELAKAIGVPEDWEGCMTKPAGAYKVKLERRMNVKIDGERLRHIAEAHNLTRVMDICFRWKPELNKREWRQAGNDVRRIFAPAMEITPGKASFTVTPINEEV